MIAGETTFAWKPSAEQLEQANVVRLARSLGCADYASLHRLSIEEPDRFWRAVVDDLELALAAPWERVLDDSRGIEWTTWFEGARLNLATACVHVWAERTPDAVAAIFAGEDGERTEWSFRELSLQVARFAESLAALGVEAGDRVAIYLPMCPEVAVVSHACAHLGAIQVPIFSGFGAAAVAQRLQDSGARVVVTADWSYRRGRKMQMRETIEEARRSSPSVEHVVEWRRADRSWSVPLGDGTLPPLEVPAEHPYLLAYTSGTTGRPKGAAARPGWLPPLDRPRSRLPVGHPRRRSRPLRDRHGLDHGAVDGGRSRRARRGRRLHGRRARLARRPDLAPRRDGARDDARRLADARPGADPEGRARGRSHLAAGDHDDRRALERRPVRLAERARGRRGRIPIVNISGGTEVGACFLSVTPMAPTKPCSLGFPALGQAMDVFSPEGTSLRGEVGELVCTRAWPGMTRGIWGDDARYLETYWSRFPGVWTHGDWASIDEDGYWSLHGRSDDTLNIAGKRIGPAELESAALDHPAVAEAAAVGIPHEVKGEVAWLFCGLRPGAEADDGRASRPSVGAALGKAFAPERVFFVSALPKTRSAKIVRRAVRATALGEDPGDLSTLENPETLEEIANAV